MTQNDTEHGITTIQDASRNNRLPSTEVHLQRWGGAVNMHAFTLMVACDEVGTVTPCTVRGVGGWRKREQVAGYRQSLCDGLSLKAQATNSVRMLRTKHT